MSKAVTRRVADLLLNVGATCLAGVGAAGFLVWRQSEVSARAIDAEHARNDDQETSISGMKEKLEVIGKDQAVTKAIVERVEKGVEKIWEKLERKER